MDRAGTPGFARDENGGGTVFGLFTFLALAAIAGIGVDTANAYRNQTMLTSVADIGAHAGAVAIAEDMTEQEIRDRIQATVTANLPVSLFGNVMDASTDVVFANYDQASRSFSSAGPKNAVLVGVQRTRANGNSVGTYLLKFAGINEWNVTATSAAVYDINANCKSTDGIYSKEKVTLTSQIRIGAGYCVHSEDYVWLPQQNSFEAGSYVTMPILALCEDKCTTEANPGIVAWESHMVFPDFGEMIDDAATHFQQSLANDFKAAFFAEMLVPNYDGTLDEADRTWLRNEIPAGQDDLVGRGILDAEVEVGTVVDMTLDEFHATPILPEGLVYRVNCPLNGNGPNTRMRFDASTARLVHSVVVTSCSLNFDDGSHVVGSHVITTRASTTATVSSGSSVIIADESFACDRKRRTVLMSKGPVQVPAEFVASNVMIVADAKVDIASATSGALTSKGFAVYASEEVHISSQHRFEACPGNVDPIFDPVGRIVRVVTPPNGTVVASN